MKLYTPDKQMLIEVQLVSTHPDGIMIEGKIMGAMPMKAILRPEELQGVFPLLSWPLVMRAVKMFFQRKKKAVKN